MMFDLMFVVFYFRLGRRVSQEMLCTPAEAFLNIIYVFRKITAGKSHFGSIISNHCKSNPNAIPDHDSR